jgi:hypothetical protein
VRNIRKLTLATAAAAASMIALATPALASGDRHGDVIRAEVIGSLPAPADPVIAGIAPGGAPWIMTHNGSEARVRSNGRIDVRVRGLVLTATGATPFPTLVATLVCDDMAVDSTAPFADGTDGVGRTRDTLMVPPSCGNPMVLIQPGTRTDIYIGLTVPDMDD